MAGPERLRLVTWNVNSIRLRIGRVLDLIDREQPDLLCLQEIKIETDRFPLEPFTERGYVHAHVCGMKAYHGVATLSRQPVAPRPQPDWAGKGDARHAWVHVPGDGGGFDLHNFYVPAGGDVPDPKANDKFDHKLRFVDEMTDWFSGPPGARSPGNGPAVLVGDLNIAPLEHDVWSHKRLLKIVSHTPIEIEKLTRLQQGRGWVDALRRFVPADRKLYSWWSYRARDWSAADKGRRLDHIWVTPDLADRLLSGRIVREARGWERPSDHAPVIVDLKK